MNIKNVYILDDRAILYINGEDAKEFLQNLISNDINKVSDVNSCFSSLLTPQGKFLYEFIIVKHKSGYILDCEKPQAEELYKQLSLYKLRSKVEILNLSNEFVVAAFSHEKFLTFDGAKDQPGCTIKYREDSIFLDLREFLVLLNKDASQITWPNEIKQTLKVRGIKVVEIKSIEELDKHKDVAIILIHKKGTLTWYHWIAYPRDNVYHYGDKTVIDKIFLLIPKS